MRKVTIDRPGGTDRLQLAEHPDLEPTGPGEKRVEVTHIGVNYADCVVRMGLYASAKKYVGWPITPGFEVSGTCDGEPVVAVTRFGGYSTQLVLPANQIFALPKTMSPAEAAAFPTVFLTAWFALFELAHPHPGDTILVHSAAGGVGGALCQLARRHGCRVVGVVGQSHKVEVARAAGAHQVIDKSTEDLWTTAERYAPHGYDVICDANGVATLQDSYDHLGAPGKLVVYGFHTMMPKKGGRPNWLKLAWGWLRTPRFDPLKMTSDNRSVLAFNLSYLFDKTEFLEAAMRALISGFESGELRAPPVTIYPLDQVAEAHSALESGSTVGKLVLAV